MKFKNKITHLNEEFEAKFFAHLHNIQLQSVLLLGKLTIDITNGLVKILSQRELEIHTVDSFWISFDSKNFDKQSLNDLIRSHNCPMSNLRRDWRQFEEQLRSHPCKNSSMWHAILRGLRNQENSAPLFKDASIDLVAIPLAFNYLSARECEDMLSEAARVLKRNGKLLITVLLADECVDELPIKLEQNPTLTRFPTEMQFIRALADNGLHGIQIVNSESPMVIEEGGAELRTFIFEAYKGKKGDCLDQGHAVIFRGPWSEVYDDDGHRYVRGERTAVCAKTYALLTTEPYRSLFIGLPACNAPSLIDAPLFDCSTSRVRHPKVTKGLNKITGEVKGNVCC